MYTYQNRIFPIVGEVPIPVISMSTVISRFLFSIKCLEQKNIGKIQRSFLLKPKEITRQTVCTHL